MGYLRQASLLGLGGHLVGVSLQHPTVLFAVLLVLGPGVALPERPVHPHLQSLLQVPGDTQGTGNTQVTHTQVTQTGSTHTSHTQVTHRGNTQVTHR